MQRRVLRRVPHAGRVAARASRRIKRGVPGAGRAGSSAVSRRGTEIEIDLRREARVVL